MPRSTRLIDNECYPQMPGSTRLIDDECYPQMPGSTRLIDDENDECYPQMPGSTHQKPTSDTYRTESKKRPHRERQITDDTYRTDSRILRSGLTVREKFHKNIWPIPALSYYHPDTWCQSGGCIDRTDLHEHTP